MSGNKIGGQKAAVTNKRKYGESFYAKIGKKGGQNSSTGGFYYSKVNGLDVHIKAGRKGGKASRRSANREAARKDFQEGFHMQPEKHWYDRFKNG